MNDSILSLWHIMAQEQTVGLVKRLFLVDAPIKIFGVYKYPEKIYGVAFSFTKDVKINLDSFRNLKELSIQLVQIQPIKQTSFYWFNCFHWKILMFLLVYVIILSGSFENVVQARKLSRK